MGGFDNARRPDAHIGLTANRFCVASNVASVFIYLTNSYIYPVVCLTLRTNHQNFVTRNSQSNAVVKRIFATTGNLCAFPECRTILYDVLNDIFSGEMCHIAAVSPQGPRFDPHMTDEERNSPENLIILCPTHHNVIDQKPEKYSSQVLKAMKRTHESRVASTDAKSPVINDRKVTDLRRQVDLESVDFGIICSLTVELEALREVFSELVPVEPTSSSSVYFRAKMKVGDLGSYRIVVSFAGNYGNLNSTRAAADLIHDWSPRYILAFGIAAGVTPRVMLTDVVVSSQVVYYEHSKLLDGERSDQRWRSFTPDYQLLNAFRANLVSINRKVNLELSDRFSEIFKSNISVGAIASGDKIIKSEKQIKRFTERERSIIAFEMESAGIATAATAGVRQVGFLTIRGISDTADGSKHDDVRSLAATRAAFCLRHFLASKPISFSEGEWPGQKEANVSERVSDRRKELFEVINENSHLEELKNFCFIQGFDIDFPSGDHRSSQIRKLILLFERRNNLDVLEAALGNLFH
jgi:nucleoside phosphorylase